MEGEIKYQEVVFPAIAGVILRLVELKRRLISISRNRGSDSTLIKRTTINGAVFPAIAGVILA